MKTLLMVLGVCCSLGLMGCQSYTAESAKQPIGFTACGDERPTVCTREYAPVCAVRGEERVTYVTACTACADERVSGYTDGVCEGDAE